MSACAASLKEPTGYDTPIGIPPQIHENAQKNARNDSLLVDSYGFPYAFASKRLKYRPANLAQTGRLVDH